MKPESKICVSIGNIPFDTITGILARVEMAEIRLDLIEVDDEGIETIFASHPNLIATCREGDYDNRKRTHILEKAIEYGAAWVDIEADADTEWRNNMINSAKESDCKLILSRHFYTHTPAPAKLRKYIDEMFNIGADIVKVAALVNQPSDAAALLGLYSEYKNLVSIGMGPLGTVTRVASPFLNAPFTFAYYGETPPTAAGQVEFQELSQLIDKISSYG